MRITRLLAVPLAAIALVAMFVACAPIKSGPTPSLPFDAAHPQAQALYHLVNAERAAHGLGHVGWNDQLGGLAQNWSNHQAATGSMQHQNLHAILDSPGYGHFSGMGENVIAGGCGTSAAQMHQAWMNSAPHRANILGNFNAIGIGIACGGGSVYATQDFAR